ncbi:hypothetical protein PV328_001014 [Microctonus aethiopoides]|uniref:Uncharacterized protein n=1 Tax=Microctonus aethiopoides TaxID=144406 RepID=A0AA39FWK5_9HYME|nr:hypothetical protein PV328_001014 [Microctonus aethiopoides]
MLRFKENSSAQCTPNNPVRFQIDQLDGFSGPIDKNLEKIQGTSFSEPHRVMKSQRKDTSQSAQQISSDQYKYRLLMAVNIKKSSSSHLNVNYISGSKINSLIEYSAAKVTINDDERQHNTVHYKYPAWFNLTLI